MTADMNPDELMTAGATCMHAMEHTMQIFPIEPLKQRALQVLAGQLDSPVTTGAMAVALAVPLWVAEAVLAALLEDGDALFAGGGWRLSCSAGAALALTLPALHTGARTCTGGAV